jgi:ProP effector
LVSDHAKQSGTALSNSKPQRIEQACNVIEALAERWPRCFALLEQHRRPLKNGIRADILAAGHGVVTADEIKFALRHYCGSVTYLQACVGGADRINLDGEVAGRVSPDEARFAAEVLARRQPHQPNPALPPQAPESIKRLTLADLKTAAARKRGAA